MGSENDVVRLRSGQVEWRIDGLALRMDDAPAQALARQALSLFDWTTASQLGLQVSGTVRLMADMRHLRDEQERLRASGTNPAMEIVQRPILVGEWTSPEEELAGQSPKVRRFTKDVAKAPPAAPVVRKVVVRTTDKVQGDWSIDVQLFENPLEQLAYEVRHAYLMSVPISQREQWHLGDYDIMDSFLVDIASQSGAVSRSQIISAVVDVVTGRVNDVNSRRPRPLREGGGDDGRPVIVRADGAVAWRANVSAGTAAARRIMWWRTPAGVVELARLATHDDMDMPKR